MGIEMAISSFKDLIFSQVDPSASKNLKKIFTAI
jgi:hypothetical protein